MAQEILFGIESYISRSPPLSTQRVVNCFLEKQPKGAKGQMPVFGAPGLSPWIELPKSPVRGFWNFNGQLYSVAGNGLYRINRAGGYKLIGEGITGTNIVSMSDNGTQVTVVNGTGGWIATNEDVFNQIQQSNFFSANKVLFFDGYFVLDRRGTNEFFLSGLFDGNSYSGLDFASAEAQPGTLTTIAQNLQLLFLGCQNHFELWYDAGTADFPFQRYAGGVIEKGIIAPQAIINQDEAIFFLGKDLVFYRLQGNVPIRVSTHGVEAAFESYGDVSDAFCFTYTLQGHKMVHLTFPSAPGGGHSWVFDISSGMWHERESWDENGVNLGRWRGNCAVEIYDKILIGDAYSGKIGYLDWNEFTEYGNTLQMLIHSANVASNRSPVFVTLLEQDWQTGAQFDGVDYTGAIREPQVMLRWSKDGGQTWSKRQRFRGLGKVGQYVRRVRWKNIGRAYEFVFEITVSDNVPRVLIQTFSDIEVGME